MTRKTGQITTPQAMLGGLVLLAFAASIILVLDLLIERNEQAPALEAPAQQAADERCPPASRSITPARVTASALIECPSAYDGALVRYRGEVVRAVLQRGDRAWVQLNDDPYGLELGPLPEHRTTVGGNSGIPVSIPASLAREINHVGDSRHYGDLIAVKGIFHRADPRDGGAPTVQAQQAWIIRAGRPVADPVNRARMVVVGLLSLTVAVLALRTGRPRLLLHESRYER